jgi:type I restriction-modification system DNA methylase subunit
VPAKKKAVAKNGTSANLGLEQKLWAAADKMRGHMGSSDYKHVALDLIFLKYISDAFEERQAALLKDKNADPEDRDEYTAENVFLGAEGGALAPFSRRKPNRSHNCATRSCPSCCPGRSG